MKKAVWTLCLLMVFFHQLEIGAGLANGNLILVKDSIIVLALVIFLFVFHDDGENNFFLHMAKSGQIAMFALLLYLPINLIASLRFEGNLNNSISSLLSELPKMISSFIINAVSLIPLVAIASLICFFFLLRKKKAAVKLEDHFIDPERKD